jgi:solute carrier family 35 (UDP-xylose/UDP-N-acetylglucosamine transporter), member B4
MAANGPTESAKLQSTPGEAQNGSITGHQAVAGTSTAVSKGAQENAHVRSRSRPVQSTGTDSARGLIRSAVARSLVPEWFNLIAIFGLIFGGCCANVFALESIIKDAPGSGTLITCVQFILISLFTLPSSLDLSRGMKHLWLRERVIPLQIWLIYTAFFITVNILNNKAFSYKISVPLHIILRSAGPVANMAVGYVSGKRYSQIRVIAVALLFLGVVVAALTDAHAKGAQIQLMTTPAQTGETLQQFWTGFGILFLALVLSAVMGLFTDAMYARFGRCHTSENLFYSHSLSLPYFLLQWQNLQARSSFILTSPPVTSFMATSVSLSRSWPWYHAIMSKVPIQLLFLLLNAGTQYLCISGVNELSARSSSLTVGIVLNIRKLVSLLLSIWLFGNRLAPGVLVGAAVVFIGGALYALPGGKQPSSREQTPEVKKEL